MHAMMPPISQFKRFDVGDLIRRASNRFPKSSSAWAGSRLLKA
jgi:hypothetical protein